jgi:Ca-activated chloride channel family protein
VRVTRKDSCAHVHTQKVGTRERYLAGTYDLEFNTTPIIRVEDVRIKDGRIVPVSIPEPGLLTLNTGTAGYGGILYLGEGQRTMVVPFSGQDPSGRYHLQPGPYMVMFRAKHATKTDLTVTRPLDIRAGGNHHIDF